MTDVSADTEELQRSRETNQIEKEKAEDEKCTG